MSTASAVSRTSIPAVADLSEKCIMSPTPRRCSRLHCPFKTVIKRQVSAMKHVKLIAAVCAASLLSLAQIGISTMTGRVVDASGAIVPGVVVTITSLATNVNVSAITNEEGIYRVPSLQPGTYRVQFEAKGFKKSLVDIVELRSGD